VVMSIDSEDLADVFVEVRTLALGNGVAVQFTQADVPNPPALTFATDISRLSFV